MEPIISGHSHNGIETRTFKYPNGLKKIITNDVNSNKIAVETFKHFNDKIPYKIKNLTYSPVLGWMGTTIYTNPSQALCYDIKDYVVKGAHLDTARPDIHRPLNMLDNFRFSDVRSTLNRMLKQVK